MNRKTLVDTDLREVPAYSIGEAADYLRVPKSTLRAWFLGQGYGRRAGFFRPVIGIADRAGHKLSFINVVEAFVAGLR